MSDFKSHVIHGLQESPKQLSSRYFYDERGDKLFQEIMKLEEYYLPRCEREIIREQSADIIDAIDNSGSELRVIELGAGDGTKTVDFLKAFSARNISVNYFPLDISSDILKENKKNIQRAIPGIQVCERAGNYFETLAELPPSSGKQLLLFLGSSIGNYPLENSDKILGLMTENLSEDDSLLIAYDLKKNPRIIEAAYDDIKGVTREFNLNLLKRINRELGADFKLDTFMHFPTYNPVTGKMNSYLLSKIKQTVTISDGTEFEFDRYEPIQTEVSQKYQLSWIEDMAFKAGLSVKGHFTDRKNYYVLSLFKVK